MANFIASYDLNGPRPTHQEMDKHIAALGAGFVRGRVLETVWYIAGPATAEALRNYLMLILDPTDQVLVAETDRIAWSNLLVDSGSLKSAFEAQPVAA